MNSLTDTIELARLLAQSGFFQDVRDVSQALAKILCGRELGFEPIASLTGIFIRDGRPCFHANLIASAIQRSGTYRYEVKRLDHDGCALAFFTGSTTLGVSSFTMEDARQAELTTGRNAHSWKKYSRNMCFARAISNGAKWYCPAVFGGITPYVPEELGAPVTEETAMSEAPATPALPAPEAREEVHASSLTEASGTEATPSDLVPVMVLSDRQTEPVAQEMNPGPKVTTGQLRLLITVQKRAKVSDDQIHAHLQHQYGITSRKNILQKDLNDVLEILEERGASAALETEAA